MRAGAWHLRRLRAMEPREIGLRVLIEARHRADDALWRVSPTRWRRGWYPELDLPATTEPVGFLTQARAACVRTHAAPAVGPLVARAEAALAGRFAFFGREDELERPLDFFRDAETGYRWPADHAKRIDHRGAAGADPKWIWELNRCQHLPLLVEAWLLTGRDEFARCAADDLLTWIRAVPPGRGIAWPNGYETALRAISFAVAADGLRGSGILDRAAERDVATALWQHARWILRDPSPGSSANNHRLTELVGLLALGVLAPDLPGASAWCEQALRELEVEARRQVLPDGGGAEQAFGYFVYVVDLLVLACALLRRAGRPASAAIDDALRRAAAAFAAQLSADEPAPAYGDRDEAFALVLDGTAPRDPRGPCAAIAAALGVPEAALVAPQPDAAACWLFGPEGVERAASTPPARPPGDVHLRDLGLVVLRAAGRRALVDVGPLGYLSLAAHGHADALQVSLAERAGGTWHELVGDPGVGSYLKRPDRRRAFRGTGFHATVEVDGLDQSEAGGPFLWTRHARVRVLAVDLGRRLVVAEHDGYSRLPDPVRHVRVVALLEDGALLVYDRLDAAASHRYRQTWPLAPELSAAVVEGRHAFRAERDGEERLSLRVAGPEGSLSVDCGSEQPLRGWWSPALEVAVPAPFCTYELRASGAVHLAALLCPAPAARPDGELAVEVAGSRCRVLLVGGGDVELAAFDLADSGSPRCELAPGALGR